MHKNASAVNFASNRYHISWHYKVNVRLKFKKRNIAKQFLKFSNIFLRALSYDKTAVLFNYTVQTKSRPTWMSEIRTRNRIQKLYQRFRSKGINLSNPILSSNLHSKNIIMRHFICRISDWSAIKGSIQSYLDRIRCL